MATSSQILSISKDGNATFMVTSFLFLPFVSLYCAGLTRVWICLLYPLLFSWMKEIHSSQQLGQLKQTYTCLSPGVARHLPTRLHVPHLCPHLPAGS